LVKFISYHLLKDKHFFLVDDVKVLNKKDLEWSKENIPSATTESPESENAEEEQNNDSARKPPKKKVARTKKVRKAMTL